MAVFDRTRAWVWGVGLLNGVLAGAGVEAFAPLLAWRQVFLLPLRLAVPYGLLVAWRAAVYVRALLEGRADRRDPVMEGFAVAALSFVAFNASEVWAALGRGGGVGGLFYLFYIVVVGGAGAAVAGVLATLDLMLVEARLRSRSRRLDPIPLDRGGNGA